MSAGKALNRARDKHDALRALIVALAPTAQQLREIDEAMDSLAGVHQALGYQRATPTPVPPHPFIVTPGRDHYSLAAEAKRCATYARELADGLGNAAMLDAAQMFYLLAGREVASPPQQDMPTHFAASCRSVRAARLAPGEPLCLPRHAP